MGRARRLQKGTVQLWGLTIPTTQPPMRPESKPLSVNVCDGGVYLAGGIRASGDVVARNKIVYHWKVAYRPTT